ncbi:fucose 4-O-acetylase-like acetyltransferase [Paraburkholderia sp. BL6669N2]|uniref:acyltransferase family protein n=1 Tax=Paraburkholderia sp. BL6669N2 TaxID=1938807 RepID=UPI000E2437A2|nr:acyltransferase family protein [Paraburkholderia sp. BL6669N2]REG57759.1 fucose 4-O-acetylase-like acetyltransferase [Paraburkholderia sp. BL6669N2]
MHERKISFVKGIGMVFVVAGHCTGAYDFAPFVPYSFHMPLFFFISGYLVSEKYLDAPLSFVWRRAKSLIIPYYKYYIAFGILTTLASKLCSIEYFGTGWYTPSGITESIISGGNIQIYTSGWFLVSLFISMCLFSIIAFASRKFGFHYAIVLIALFPAAILAMSYGQQKHADHVINLLVYRNIVSLFFVWAGFVVRAVRIRFPTPSFAALALAFLVQFYVMHASASGISFVSEWNSYPNLWSPFITSAAGIVFVFGLADILSRATKPGDLLERIGENSLHVMAMHLAIFQAINIVACISNGWPVSTVGKDPSMIYQWPKLWPLYVGTGLVLPVLLVEKWRKWRSISLMSTVKLARRNSSRQR